MNTSSWKYFLLGDMFRVVLTKGDIKANDMEYGSIPLISSGEGNNGVVKYISKEGDGKAEMFPDNTITLDMFCHANYQDKEYFAVGHGRVNVLIPKFNINSYVGLFICSLINREKYRFSYGRAVYSTVAEKIKIKLPVTPAGTPDWKFMEDFVKDQIIPQLPKKAQKVWLQKYDTTPQKHEDMKLNTQEWKYYTIGDLFRVELTKGDIKADEVDSGDIPLISSGEGNNGVVKYISKEGDGKAEMFPDNTITLDMFCHASYQGIHYYAVGHGRVNILFPKFELNKYIGIFICTLINREEYRFSYGRAVYSTVAEKMKIKLPVTPAGTPDWKFMEDYIKSLPFSRNIEPSKPNEVVDELVEMKKEMIKMRRAMEAQQSPSNLVNYGTVNIYEK